jgi:hypothetical protein
MKPTFHRGEAFHTAGYRDAVVTAAAPVDGRPRAFTAVSTLATASAGPSMAGPSMASLKQASQWETPFNASVSATASTSSWLSLASSAPSSHRGGLPSASSLANLVGASASEAAAVDLRQSGMRVRVDTSCGEMSLDGLNLKKGDKVLIRQTYAAHAGKWAYVEGFDKDDRVRVRLEGPTMCILALSPMHLNMGGSSEPLVPLPRPELSLSFLQDTVQIPELRKGSKVLLGGEACPEKFRGKYGYVAKPDVGDGSGCAKIRIEPTYSVHEGFISSGGTFMSEMMTIEEAKVKCALMGGVGFTHAGGLSCGPVLIYFKNKWDCKGVGWTSYKLETDPEGLLAWTKMSHMHLTLC